MGSTKVWALITVVMLAAVIGVFAFRHSEMAGQKKEHSVTLHWDPAPQVTVYHVYRRTEKEEFKKIGSSQTPTYVDKPVPSGAVFYYGVTTVIGTQESKISNVIRVEVPND
jgi:fibronectin type 3 domain-containing protein